MAKFERVECPQCKTAYKVGIEQADELRASLPDGCETCHPKVVRENVGPSETVVNSKLVQNHEARIGQLEARMTALAQDLTKLLDIMQRLDMIKAGEPSAEQAQAAN